MKIERIRYVVMRNNRSEIWGGCAKNFQFRKVSELKDMEVKTYRSEKQALAGCSSWDRNFEVVKCRQTIEIDPVEVDE